MYLRAFFGGPVKSIVDLYVGGKIVEKLPSGRVLRYQHSIRLDDGVIVNIASYRGRVCSVYGMRYDEKNRPTWEMWSGFVGEKFHVLQKRYKIHEDGTVSVECWINDSRKSHVERIIPLLKEGIVSGALIEVVGSKRVGRITCEYQLQQLKSERIYLPNGLVKEDRHDSTEYVYDKDGRVVSMIDRCGEEVVTAQSIYR